MNITVELHERDFNVALSSPGKEPFLTIKNCRVVDGAKGRFVSGPAKKLDSGKWFNFTYMSDGFSTAVLAAYDEAVAKQAPPARKAAPARGADDFSEPPF